MQIHCGRSSVQLLRAIHDAPKGILHHLTKKLCYVGQYSSPPFFSRKFLNPLFTEKNIRPIFYKGTGQNLSGTRAGTIDRGGEDFFRK